MAVRDRFIKLHKLMDPKIGDYVAVGVITATGKKFYYNTYTWTLGAWIYVAP